jgi:hypothetical protein
MAWMGTRDIYTALFITLIFSICSNFLFNEDSGFCCLPESFITKNAELLETPPEVSDQQVADAVATLANWKKYNDAATKNDATKNAE